MSTRYVNSTWTNGAVVTINGNDYVVNASGSAAFSTLAGALTAAQNGDTVAIVASEYPGAGKPTDNIFRSTNTKRITVTTSNAELTGTDTVNSINIGEIDVKNQQLTFSAIKASTQQLKLYNDAVAILLVENGSDLTFSAFSIARLFSSGCGKR